LTRILLRLLIADLLLGAAGPSAGQVPTGPLHLIDVPFLPQSEALCGGAAAAMVMRYWGETGVYAETFSDLVDSDTGGIRGEDLLRALRERGWQAVSFRGDAPVVQQHLASSRPVITLLEDRPGRYHYVVVVGWARGRVILHDPARAPFRILGEDAFIRAWEPSGFWTLLATKSPPTITSSTTAASTPAAATGPCQSVVDEGVRQAAAGDMDGARRLFEMAREMCPQSAGPWREMAGLHALRTEWAEAAADARQALARDRYDELAARILATALYLEGHSRAALAAWNLADEPRIDLVNIQGLDRTRYAVAAAAIGIEPGSVLTPAALDRARRRLDELPAAALTRVEYRPAEDGRANVEAVVVERPLAPTSVASLARIGVRALTDREVAASIAGPSGGGESWQASWRFWERRPRVAVGFDAPAPFGGTWGIEAAQDRQTYVGGGETLVETRRGAGFHVSDWTHAGLRWEVSAGVDAWRGAGRAAVAGLALDQVVLDDRLTLGADAAGWTLPGRPWTLRARSEWRSSQRNEGSTWHARVGLTLAAARAPLALWPGAGTGQGRDVLLRAHPLLHDGVVRDGIFGRRLLDGGAEWRRWATPRGKLLRIAPAVFVDIARASRGLPGADGRWHADAGAGLRISVPGSGALRIDLARGLRDGGMALSAGWIR
jgi:peptidase C39-like protein